MNKRPCTEYQVNHFIDQGKNVLQLYYRISLLYSTGNNLTLLIRYAVLNININIME